VRKVSMLIFALCSLPISFVRGLGMWEAVLLIAFAASVGTRPGPPASTRPSPTPSPKEAVASVSGLGGFVGSIGGTIFPIVAGRHPRQQRQRLRGAVRLLRLRLRGGLRDPSPPRAETRDGRGLSLVLETKKGARDGASCWRSRRRSARDDDVFQRLARDDDLLHDGLAVGELEHVGVGLGQRQQGVLGDVLGDLGGARTLPLTLEDDLDGRLDELAIRT
jgi:hypothetical protein